MNAALKGIRVLDLSERLAGPFASTILCDFGAEVVKIAPLYRVEEEPLTEPLLGQDNYYFTINRNKKSILLNLKKPEGKDIFHRLVKKSDIVINNFRPGVVEKLGIDYSTLNSINQKIVCCSITGFGSSGPYASRPCYDGIIQALSGAMSVTGEPGGKPLVSGMPIADFSAPLFAAHAILAALFDAQRTGQGQNIEVSLLASTISLLQLHAADYFTSGDIPGPAGSGENVIKGVVNYGAFKTKDGYIFLTAHRSFEKFCKAIGREDLIENPRFNSPAKRRKNREELNSIAIEILAKKETEEWCEILNKADVPHTPINSVDKALLDPQVLHLGMRISQEKQGQKFEIIGSPIKMPGIKKKFEPAALPGESTDEVLTNILDLKKETIEELRAGGIIL
ncbi:MAG: CoA transferase [Thermodesulfobacteriota bacterium]|nr:CoA transferase [Thermodesulfobacteriota bacterium]